MATTLRADVDTPRGKGAAPTLGDLVTRAAATAPEAVAVTRPDVRVSFGQLAGAARAAMTSMASSSSIDDSTLTVALMMTVPGLAASGPSGLAATLASLRASAVVAAGA
ncbi:MAG: hypothetical protein INR72_00030 [Williamsia herbipolensis]|uniref:Uncharacterized protein n=1 Tax=Williamsia serinedens TaxID=391736 RepID=A0ABT1H366_9NOCA|nr:hypothetical protein [Williamsia serinedens]MBE7159600.1 hypothetical protein [Williamsia herbipolensis]MCP2161409.1 hypothetical protein [Williamsia serinedens]